MLVEARAHIRNEDIQRIQKKAECVPGDVFDLPDGLAEVYLKQGLVVRVKQKVEFAAHAGGPERAVTRGGRLPTKSPRPRSPENGE